ncbi:unannotated protein [freshwater metagenome]|uniref:Unannotated protein n=1 Tax=freshwater metagenome TaxID=449393 RepID=A0A6J7ITG8_9ZZZZ
MCEVLSDLLRIDIKRSDELHITDVVFAELNVHEARHAASWICVLVVLDTLHE